MKLKDLAQRKSLVGSILASKQKPGFRAWASAIRTLIPVADMSSAQLYRHYVIETREVWENLKEIYGKCSLETLKEEAVKCKALAAEKECKVLEFGRQRER